MGGMVPGQVTGPVARNRLFCAVTADVEDSGRTRLKVPHQSPGEASRDHSRVTHPCLPTDKAGRHIHTPGLPRVPYYVGASRQNAGTVTVTGEARVGRSTAYSSLLQSTHGTFLVGASRSAAVGLGPRAPGLCREAAGASSGLLSGQCVFCREMRDIVRVGGPQEHTRLTARITPAESLFPGYQGPGPPQAGHRGRVFTFGHKPSALAPKSWDEQGQRR